MNRLQTVFEQNQRTTRYTYDVLGNLETIESSNVQSPGSSVRTGYYYDQVNRLHTMEVAGGTTADPQPLASYTYDLGRTRKRNGVAETINGSSRAVAYTYDLLDRLAVEEISEGGASFTISYRANGAFLGYDKVGNRRSREVSGFVPLPGVTQFQNQGFDINDRLMATSSYDANGNTTIESLPAPAVSPSVADEYDFENRLVKRQRLNVPGQADISVEITYDGDGNRVKKHILDYSTQPTTETTITYLVDNLNPTGYAQVLREQVVSARSGSTAAAATALYCYGHDLLSQNRTAQTFFPPSLTTSVRWYGYDGHGSVRFLVAENNGTITDAYNYEAFGILIDGFETSANDYLYAGEQLDRHLGLYNDRARYMNPNTGRFWSMDSFEGTDEDPYSLHKYLYAHADPVNNIDPSGQLTTTELIVVTGVALNIAFLAADSASLAKNQASGNLRGVATDSVSVAIDMALLTIPFTGAGGAVVRSSKGVIQMAVASAESAKNNIRLAWYGIRSAMMLAENSGDSSEGEAAPSSSSSSAGSGPGNWQKVPESMSERARKYQAAITGRAADEVYVVNGVKFDGYKRGTLLEAKGAGYAAFIGRDGKFYRWFKGQDALVKQAARQVKAAGGKTIEWHVAEKDAADTMRKLLQDNGYGSIRVIHTP